MLKKKRVKPIIIKEMGRNVSLINDVFALFKLIQLFKKGKPDIIGTHTAKAGVLEIFGTIFFNIVEFKKSKNKKYIFLINKVYKLMKFNAIHAHTTNVEILFLLQSIFNRWDDRMYLVLINYYFNFPRFRNKF